MRDHERHLKFIRMLLGMWTGTAPKYHYSCWASVMVLASKKLHLSNSRFIYLSEPIQWRPREPATRKSNLNFSPLITGAADENIILWFLKPAQDDVCLSCRTGDSRTLLGGVRLILSSKVRSGVFARQPRSFTNYIQHALMIKFLSKVPASFNQKLHKET